MLLAESQRKGVPCLHVASVSRSSKVVLQKREELLAVCLIALWCNIVQARLERFILGIIHPDCKPYARLPEGRQDQKFRQM